MDTFQSNYATWQQNIENAQDLNTLEHVRLTLLGKQGEITQAMKSLGDLDLDARKQRGRELNDIRQNLSQRLDEKHHQLTAMALTQKLASESIDITLPSRPIIKGVFHPISQTLFEVMGIFQNLGFSLADGNHIEEDYYNFDALNIPPEHPARQDHDTFYMPSTQEGTKKVLRTQTTTVQIRTLLAQKPPLRFVAPGRTFRSDYDQTHTPNFHQIEGLMLGDDIHMGHLKYCLTQFYQRFFNIPDLPVRFRPSYFPFTEPSAEVDIGYHKKKDQLVLGYDKSNQSSQEILWLEIGGCGMVHETVLKNCQIDPQQYQGFAFGMGIERMAMLKYGIADLRAFYETDLRWLRRHGFSIAHGLMAGESA
ncbi:MAG: phenylalanine--tRNA ligase subunit alpha [Janthinobacterium lividum]